MEHKREANEFVSLLMKNQEIMWDMIMWSTRKTCLLELTNIII